MECDFSKISRYVDRQLSEAERVEVEEHLKTCARCASYHQQLSASLSYLRRMGRIELPVDFSARLSWRLEHEVSQKVARSFRRRALKRYTVYASIAAAVIILISVFLPELTRPPVSPKKEMAKEERKEPGIVQKAMEEPTGVVAPPEVVERGTAEEVTPRGVVHVEPEHPVREEPEEKTVTAKKLPEPQQETPERAESTTSTETKKVRVSPEIAAAEVEKLEKFLENGTTSTSSATLIEVIRSLGNFDTPKTYALLQKVLSPESELNKEVRKEALFSLANLDTKDAARTVLFSFSDPDWEVRDSAPIALSRMEEEKTIEYLAGEVLPSGKLDEFVRASAAWALGQTKGQVRTELLASAFKNEKNPKVRYAICEALGKRKESGAEEALSGALSDPVWYVRDIALAGLARVGTPDSVEKIIKCLADQNLLVRESAAFALSRIPDTRSLAPLIKALHTKDKRLYGSVLASLVRITGKEFSSEAEWKRWLKSIGENPEIPPNPQAKVPASSYFLGIPLHTRRVIFLVDCSFGMERSGKIREAKKELKNAIGSLESDVLFNVIFFEATHRYFSSQQFVQATEENKSKAARFIDSVRPTIGGRNLYDILAKCLSFEPDDIFVLTDGSPAEGKYTDPWKIVLEISRSNAFQKTRISTVGFFSVAGAQPGQVVVPVGPAVDLLRSLAEQNYGTFIYRLFPLNGSDYNR